MKLKIKMSFPDEEANDIVLDVFVPDDFPYAIDEERISYFEECIDVGCRDYHFKQGQPF